jgi:hypothetical protein
MNKDKDRVIVGLSGGLGNQMFQYAMGRALSLRLDVPLFLDLSWFEGATDRAFALMPFSISANLLPADGNVKHGRSALREITRKIAHHFFTRRLGAKVFRERYFHFDPSVLDLSESVYLDGYWQSEKYFSGFGKVVADDFSLKSPMTRQSREMLEKISGSDAICLHVRRGDYVSSPSASAVHGLCSIDYYSKALRFVMEGATDPRCFVFSDEPEWVRANLHLPLPTTIVDFNGTDMAHEDLRLMSACKHYVIANSSLSWWGAWLGRDPCKRVVAPKQWFMGGTRNTRDLIPEGWIRL